MIGMTENTDYIDPDDLLPPAGEDQDPKVEDVIDDE
jgi:hypothetical protein